MDQRKQVDDGSATRGRNAAIYVRVSTSARSKQSDATNFVQNLEVQVQPLRELVQQRGWKFHQIYSDRASGAKEKRPGLNALMADARRGQFDVVLVWRFDRFARSVKQLVLALEEFRALGIDFISYSEALDTSTPMGRAVFAIVAAIAELERNIIKERVVAGLNYAHTNGTRSGKPIGRPRAVFRHDQVFEFRNQDVPWRQIAKTCGVGVTTVRRAYQSMKAKRGVPKPGG